MFSPKIPAMAMTLRVLARLLSYPDADLRQHLRRHARRAA
jgi:nitrate reductase assembly molybdenum cofactor insertion protein NarJ